VSIFLWLTRVTRSAIGDQRAQQSFFGSRWHTDFHALHATDDHQNYNTTHTYIDTFYTILYMLRGYSFSPPIYLHYQKYFSFYMASVFVSFKSLRFFYCYCLISFLSCCFPAHNMNVFVFPPLSHFFSYFILSWWLCEKNGVCKGAKRTTTEKREREKKKRLAYARSSDYMRVTIDTAAVSRGSLCANLNAYIVVAIYTGKVDSFRSMCVCVCVMCTFYLM
jgi:hypothetical protein